MRAPARLLRPAPPPAPAVAAIGTEVGAAFVVAEPELAADAARPRRRSSQSYLGVCRPGRYARTTRFRGPGRSHTQIQRTTKLPRTRAIDPLDPQSNLGAHRSARRCPGELTAVLPVARRVFVLVVRGRARASARRARARARRARSAGSVRKTVSGDEAVLVTFDLTTRQVSSFRQLWGSCVLRRNTCAVSTLCRCERCVTSRSPR